MGKDALSDLHGSVRLVPRTSAAAVGYASAPGLSEKTFTDANDASLAELIRFRHQSQKAQGWLTLGIFAGSFGLMLGLSAVLSAHTLLAVLTATVTTLAMGAGLSIERFTRHLFVRRAQALGLSAVAGEEVYLRSRGVSAYLTSLASYGAVVRDEDIADFVRDVPAVRGEDGALATKPAPSRAAVRPRSPR